MTYKTFEEWMGEMEGFGCRQERFGEDVGHPNAAIGIKWLRTAWELGAASERAKHGIEIGVEASAIRITWDKSA